MGFREVGVVEVREVLQAWLEGEGLRAWLEGEGLRAWLEGEGLRAWLEGEGLRAWLEGEGLWKVAARAGVDRKTARRYVDAAQDAGLTRDAGPDAVTDALVGLGRGRVHPARPNGHGAGQPHEHVSAQHGGEDQRVHPPLTPRVRAGQQAELAEVELTFHPRLASASRTVMFRTRKPHRSTANRCSVRYGTTTPCLASSSSIFTIDNDSCLCPSISPPLTHARICSSWASSTSHDSSQNPDRGDQPPIPTRTAAPGSHWDVQRQR